MNASPIRGHGGAMPIWGDRYSDSAQEEFGVFGAEVVTRGRIAVLVDYLMTTMTTMITIIQSKEQK